MSKTTLEPIEIGDEIAEYLKSKPAITDMIGVGRKARIYEDSAKQGVDLPYIVFQVFQGTSQEHLNGIAGLASNRIQIDAYGSSRAEASVLAEKIRLAPLQMFRGRLENTFVSNVTSDASYDRGSDPPSKGSDRRRFWQSRDYIVTYREAIA